MRVTTFEGRIPQIQRIPNHLATLLQWCTSTTTENDGNRVFKKLQGANLLDHVGGAVRECSLLSAPVQSMKSTVIHDMACQMVSGLTVTDPSP